MDLIDLKRIFAATAVVSVSIALLALPFNSVWAGHYSVFATLAWLNWYALSQSLMGLTGKNWGSLAFGMALKPVLLVTVLIVGKYMGVEITSFLLGLNTFFVTVMFYLAYKSVRALTAPPFHVEL